VPLFALFVFALSALFSPEMMVCVAHLVVAKTTPGQLAVGDEANALVLVMFHELGGFARRAIVEAWRVRGARTLTAPPIRGTSASCPWQSALDASGPRNPHTRLAYRKKSSTHKNLWRGSSYNGVRHIRPVSSQMRDIGGMALPFAQQC